jgi:spermidine/putrescine transport system ATP-binding protein
MTSAIELEDISITYGAFQAVYPTDLSIEAGEFFSFLGPSGCGKTTLLRTISGFAMPSRGRVKIGGKDMTNVPPNRRPTALIFQNLALFPMMTVAENIGYGLRVRGVPKREREKSVAELVEQVALGPHMNKRVTELSGGQKQRVAIARALAVKPSVLLLDEPLSALDLKLRQHMRTELRSIQKRVGITFVYITHDQGEAFTMSDRIAVMNAGRIKQVGTATDIYRHPKTAFVASFVGSNNSIPCIASGTGNGMVTAETPLGRVRAVSPVALQENASAKLFVRPEHIVLNPSEGHCAFQARLEAIEFEGSMTHVHLRAECETRLTASFIGGNALEGSSIAVGSTITAGFSPRHAIVLAE